MLEAELRETTSKLNSASIVKGSFDQKAAPALELFTTQASKLTSIFRNFLYNWISVELLNPVSVEGFTI